MPDKSSVPADLGAYLTEKHKEYLEIDSREEAESALTILAVAEIARSKGIGLAQSIWAPENLAKRRDTTQHRQKLGGNYQIGKETLSPSLNNHPQKSNSPPPKFHPAGWVAPHLRYLQKNPPPTSSTSSSQGSATTEKARTPSSSLPNHNTLTMPESIGYNSVSTCTESEVGEETPHLQQKVGGQAAPSSNWASICPVKAPVKATDAPHTPSTLPRANGNAGASIKSASSPRNATSPTQYIPPHLRNKTIGNSTPSVSSLDNQGSTQHTPPQLRNNNTGNSASSNGPSTTQFIPPHLRKRNTGTLDPSVSRPESHKSSVSSNPHASAQFVPLHLRGSQQPAASTQFVPSHLRGPQQPAAIAQCTSPSPSVGVVSPLSSAAPSVCGSSNSTMNGAAKAFVPSPASPPVPKPNDYIPPHLRFKQSVLPEKTRTSSASASVSVSVARELGPASSADAFINPTVADPNDSIPLHLRTLNIAKPVGTSTSLQGSAAAVSTEKQIKSTSSAAGSTAMEHLAPHLRYKKALPSVQSSGNGAITSSTSPPPFRIKEEQKSVATPGESKPSFVPPHLRLAKGTVPAPGTENVPPHPPVNNKVESGDITSITNDNAEVNTVKDTQTPSPSGGGVSLTTQNALRPTTPTNRLTPAAQWGAQGAKLVSGDEFLKAAGSISPLKSYKTEAVPPSRRYEQNLSNYALNNNALHSRPSDPDIKPENPSSSLAVSANPGIASPERSKVITVTQSTHGRQRIVEKYVGGPAKQPPAQQHTQEDVHLSTFITQSVHQSIEIQQETQPDSRASVDKSNLLTQDALAKASGFGQSPSARGSDFKVSEEGVEQPKEGIRARQGVSAAEELMDWTGSLMPPPCDWENDRTWFDNKWTPEYIAEEWRLTVPSGREVEIDTHCKKFLEGVHPIDPVEPIFLEAVETEDSRPDIKNSENEQKRLHSTSQKELERKLKKQRKHLPTWEEADAELAAQETEAAAYQPMPNQFAPKIDIYLRPATLSDAVDVAKIYNYYICHTHIPEDQSPIMKADAEFMIKNAKDDGLPFIIAIKGKAPGLHDVQGRPVKNKKASLPACEVVVGFIFAEALNYNVKGNRKGRSRTTANLQVYVAPGTTRKGVGRNLLDHMLHSLKSTHSFEDACDWLNVDNDKIYTSENLKPNFHQLMFQLPVLQKNDPNLEGVTQFLSKNNLFREEARLFSVGRTSPEYGSPKWLDLVFFQTQAWQSEAFGGLT